MNNKRILFVVSSYIQSGTSANIRNNALIEGLCDCGYSVDVISREPDIEPGRCDNSMVIPPVRQFIYIIKHNDTQNQLDKHKDSHKKSLKALFLPIGKKIYTSISIWDTWFLKVKKIKRIELTEYYDIMISSSDPKSSHYLALKIYKQNRDKIGKWIQYWGDPFALDINQSTGSKCWIRMVEKSLLRNADKIVYVSPFTLEKQRLLYNEYSNRMCFLPIPVRSKKLTQTTNPNKDRLKIGYYGAYKKRDRNIMPLYNAINRTQHSLEIVGPSDITLQSTKHVTVFEQKRVPVEEIEKREQTADVLVCICNRSGTQIPGKAYHYAMTNKYILIILDGDYSERIKEYFDQYDRYIFCDNNEDSIISALNSIDYPDSFRTPCFHFDPGKIADEFVK